MLIYWAKDIFQVVLSIYSILFKLLQQLKLKNFWTQNLNEWLSETDVYSLLT